MFRNAATDLAAYIASNGFTTMSLGKTQEALENAFNMGMTSQPVNDSTILNPGLPHAAAELLADTEMTGTATVVDAVVPQVAKGRKKATDASA